MVRDQVKQLAEMGPLPHSDTAEEEPLMRYDSLLRSIERPVSDEEAEILCTLFGPDDCFEMAWSLVHLIETAPGWPLAQCLTDTKNEWIALLGQRLKG